MNSVEILTKVKNAIELQVKSAECHIEKIDAVSFLYLTYQCPCGEQSRFAMALPEHNAKNAKSEFVNLQVERLKQQLREHVIAEGNVPDFD